MKQTIGLVAVAGFLLLGVTTNAQAAESTLPAIYTEKTTETVHEVTIVTDQAWLEAYLNFKNSYENFQLKTQANKTDEPALNEASASTEDRGGSDNLNNDNDSQVAPAHDRESSVNSGSENSAGDNGVQGTESVEPVEVTQNTSLRFSALYPNTTGADAEEEFIEVINVGSSPLDLKDWSIKDESEKTFTFDGYDRLLQNESKQLPRELTKISLNNQGDTLQLFAPDGRLVDQVSYGSSTKGQLYEKQNNVWSWPGETEAPESNSVSETQMESIESSDSESVPGIEPDETVSSETEVSDETEETVSSETKITTEEIEVAPDFSLGEDESTSPAPAPLQVQSVGTVKTLDDGTRVAVSGVVNVSPGKLGKQIFYLQDLTGGIQIYKHDAIFGDLEAGQTVKVEGELSTARGERRLKVTKDGSIEPNSLDLELALLSVELEDLNEQHSGKLVSVFAQIQTRNGRNITLEKSGDELVVALAERTEIDPSIFTPGRNVTVTGIAVFTSGEMKLKPRTESDIALEEEEELILGGITGKTTKSSLDQSLASYLLAASLLVLGALFLRQKLANQKHGYANNYKSVVLKPEKSI